MTEHVSRRFALLSLATFLLGLTALVISAYRIPVQWGMAFFVLALATLVAENAAVALPRGVTTSLSFSLSVAANLLLGPTAAGLVALGSGVSLDDLRSRVPPLVVLFNVGQVLVAHVVGGWLYLGFGGRTLAVDGRTFEPLTSVDLPQLVLPLVVLAVSAFGINAMFVTVGFAVKYGVTPAEVWRQHLSWVFPMQMSLSVVGVFIAQVMSIELAGLVLFIFPLLVSRQVYQHYIRLKQGYLDTVRSLVGALEAKDVYTRGHSERVAEYAAAIAKSMGLSEDVIERIRLAAQLHDLGKVGLSDSVLCKAGRLTSDEYTEVRNHPQIGAEIVERVPALSELAPIVRHHHERFDGTGYVAGLRGEDIPLEARVLAVADSFDAMTSSRAYREAMSSSAALQEILECQGSQFDPSIVVHLRTAIASNSETEQQ